jgi:phosphoenolpyruvate carboxykinase (GTP)
LWPGFGENLRVLAWILDRCAGRAQASETPIGFVPRPEDLDINGLDVSAEDLRELTSVNTDQWRTEIGEVRKYLEEYGDRLPPQLRAQAEDVARRLGA